MVMYDFYGTCCIKGYNQEVHYQKYLNKVKHVVSETENSNIRGKDNFLMFMNRVGKLLLRSAAFERVLDERYFYSGNFQFLKEEINTMFEEILPENYPTSFTNPQFASHIFGPDFGQIICCAYDTFRTSFEAAFEHDTEKMELLFLFFQDFYDNIKHCEVVVLEDLVAVLKRHINQCVLYDTLVEQERSFSPSYSRYRDIVMFSDLEDERYLLRYGVYISDNELKTVAQFNNLAKEKINALSTQIVKGFLQGAKDDSKDLSQKQTVQVFYCIGYERLVRNIVKDLDLMGLQALIIRPDSAPINRQYNYDHRCKNVLFMDKETIELLLLWITETYEGKHHEVCQCGGRIGLRSFGEHPFSPAEGRACEQSVETEKLVAYYHAEKVRIDNTYNPKSETAFCVITFPSPEVGVNYDDIFRDIVEVNLLDSDIYLQIQGYIIQALDRSSHVLVKGANGNKTDLKVMFHNIDNPAKETNFLNGGATINIPAGEVFTTPQLLGTNGLLHVKDIYLKGFHYRDLELEFRDGIVTAYRCNNYDDEEQNRFYLKENLFNSHESLPMGEFAVGTNTLAYKIARKYRIQHLLPILIFEKIGPHFALGDPCFARAEDNPVYNAHDGKQVTARENEITGKRKSTDGDGIYTNVHTDITLSYDDIAYLSAVNNDGEITDIIRDGRFALEGTEMLNEHL